MPTYLNNQFVSFSGVNMYAMLTGTLPFTVEPFNLRTLHQKMVDKEMKPLPPSLSTGNKYECKNKTVDFIKFKVC